MKKVTIPLILCVLFSTKGLVAQELLPPWETARPTTGGESTKSRQDVSFTPELAVEWVDGDNEGVRTRAHFDGGIKGEKWSLSGSLDAYRWQEETFGRDKRDIFVNELYLQRKEEGKVFRIGRYRTVIGGGVIWNPFDVLDPVDPNQISLSRRGGDKASIDLIHTNGGITSLYGFPEDEGRSSGFCLRHRRTVDGTSIQPFVFTFDDALWSYGVELAGNVGKNASWLQVGRLADERGEGLQLLFGIDLAIPKAPLLRVEYFRNELRPLAGSSMYYRSIPPDRGGICGRTSFVHQQRIPLA